MRNRGGSSDIAIVVSQVIRRNACNRADHARTEPDAQKIDRTLQRKNLRATHRADQISSCTAEPASTTDVDEQVSAAIRKHTVGNGKVIRTRAGDLPETRNPGRQVRRRRMLLINQPNRRGIDSSKSRLRNVYGKCSAMSSLVTPRIDG
jgi:hypothetical protein